MPKANTRPLSATARVNRTACHTRASRCLGTFFLRSLAKVQYCGEPSRLRSGVLDLRPPRFKVFDVGLTLYKFYTTVICSISPNSLISLSSEGASGPVDPVCAPRRHKTLNQCWFTFGPPSTTLDQS